MSGEMLTPEQLQEAVEAGYTDLVAQSHEAQRERIAEMERQLAHWQVRSQAQGREVKRLEQERLAADAVWIAALEETRDSLTAEIAREVLRGHEALAALETQAEWAANKISEVVEEKVALQSALETERATVAELRVVFLRVLPECFVCEECGPLVKADEDGCCATCGRDCKVRPTADALASLHAAASAALERLELLAAVIDLYDKRIPQHDHNDHGYWPNKQWSEWREKVSRLSVSAGEEGRSDG